MHSQKRTMLASLGFADPDRREHLHELACQYLATPDALRRLIKHLGLECGPIPDEVSGESVESSQVYREVTSRQVRHEYEIAKGFGAYRTTIGFADLVVTFDGEARHVHVRQRKQLGNSGARPVEWSDWQSVPDYTYPTRTQYGVEVKITPTPIREVIRQVKFYRSYSGIDNWIVATAYGLDSSDVALLANENIRHIRLGERFREYVAMREASETEAGVEI
jgi:hypothetical protein